MLGDYLCEFAAIVQAGSISAAAERLGLSQSALTRHLASLESRLGARLLERGPSGVHMTDDGRFAYEAAAQIADLGESLREHFSGGGRRARERQIVIGGLSGPPAAARMFEDARGRLVSSGYALSLRYLQPRSPESVARALTDRSMDVVLTYEGQAAPLLKDGRFKASALYDEAVVAVFEREHPLSRLSTATLAGLRGCTFSRVVGRDENAGILWDEFARLCGEQGFAPRSHAMGYEGAPSALRRHAEYVAVCGAGSSQERRFVAAGRVCVPIADLRFKVFAVTRAEDAAACRLVMEACE